MVTRYVNARTGVAGGSFTSPAAPSRSVGAALKAAASGDTIEIQGAGAYVEDELVIDRPLTLVSSHAVAHPDVDPTATGFDPAVLPVLTVKPGARHRILRIAGTTATRTSAGPVVVRGLRIRGGRAVHTATEPVLGAGGGIAVIDIDNVRIERCVIEDNRTETALMPSWPEPDRVALRTAVVDLVGEIVSPTTERAVNAVIAAANTALTLAGLPPLAPLDRSLVLAELARKFDAKLSPGRPNSWLGGQAFGGGVAAVWASPTLRHCHFRGNVAEGRGAGLAVVGYGWPTIEHCWFDANRSGVKGRLDGGGIGCEISLPGQMPRDLSEIDLARFLTARVGAAKAAIGSPLAHLTTWDLVDFARWLSDPTRPSPPLRGVKAIVLDLIGLRFEAAADHALYYLATSALSRDRWSAWRQDEIERARRSVVTVTGCRFTGNRAGDDGGGFYASVLSRVKVSTSRFTDNVARGSGGGIRLSMGSAGEIIDCELSGNTAIVDDPTGKLVAGGGGLSARNVDLTLSGTRIGRTGPGVAADSNVCSDHAGGGIAFQADTEGALAGIPDFWTTIMREVFEVKALKVEIRQTCTIAGNGAGYDAGRRPLGRPAKAKGGGVWVVQGAFPDAPRVDLRIEGIRTTVAGNEAQTKGYASKVARGTRIATAHEVCLQDLVGSREWTEANFGPLLHSGGLHFAP